MSYICEECGKKSVYGISQKHRRGVAGRRWSKRAQQTKRVFKPNLQNFQGRKLCAKCIKKLKTNNL